MLQRALEEVPDQERIGDPIGFRLIARRVAPNDWGSGGEGSREAETLSLIVDRARDGDQIFDYEGHGVLLLEEPVARLLGSCVLDVEEAAEGDRKLRIATRTT